MWNISPTSYHSPWHRHPDHSCQRLATEPPPDVHGRQTLTCLLFDEKLDRLDLVLRFPGTCLDRTTGTFKCGCCFGRRRERRNDGIPDVVAIDDGLVSVQSWRSTGAKKFTARVPDVARHFSPYRDQETSETRSAHRPALLFFFFFKKSQIFPPIPTFSNYACHP